MMQNKAKKEVPQSETFLYAYFSDGISGYLFIQFFLLLRTFHVHFILQTITTAGHLNGQKRSKLVFIKNVTQQNVLAL